MRWICLEERAGDAHFKVRSFIPTSAAPGFSLTRSLLIPLAPGGALP